MQSNFEYWPTVPTAVELRLAAQTSLRVVHEVKVLDEDSNQRALAKRGAQCFAADGPRSCKTSWS